MSVHSDRCGYELTSDRVIEHSTSWTVDEYLTDQYAQTELAQWRVEFGVSCCHRDVWNETGRCIWHAETDEKPVNELVTARAREPARTVLDGAVLRGVELGDRISFQGCRLVGADLSAADVRGADFSGATLAYAHLEATNLREADLSEAILLRANLANADIWHADLSDADCRYADLAEAELFYSDLSGANLAHAALWRAGLNDATLSGADLSGYLHDALLARADLSDADLRNADLSVAHLSGADFSGADLSGADLRWAYLENTNVAGIRMNQGTNFSPRNEWLAQLRREGHAEILKLPYVGPLVVYLLTLVENIAWYLHEFSERGIYETDILLDENLEASRQNDLAVMYHSLGQTALESGLIGKARKLRIWERRARRKEAFARRNWRSWAGSLASWLVMGHGISLRRITASIVFIIFLCAGVFWTADISGSETFVRALDYSLTSFTGIGRSSGLPTTQPARAIVILESFVGVLFSVLLGYVLATRDSP